MFLDGEPADYIKKGSSFDRYDVFLTTNLESGNYYLVIDNTNYGLAAPPSQENGFVYLNYDIGYTNEDNTILNIDWTWMVVGAITFIAFVIMIFLFIKNKTKE